MSLALNHLNTFRAGSSGYVQHMRDRFNGTSLVRVEHDSKVWVYDNSRERRHSARAWRAFIKEVFIDATNPGQYRLAGSFPFYYLEGAA